MDEILIETNTINGAQVNLPPVVGNLQDLLPCLVVRMLMWVAFLAVAVLWVAVVVKAAFQVGLGQHVIQLQKDTMMLNFLLYCYSKHHHQHSHNLVIQ